MDIFSKKLQKLLSTIGWTQLKLSKSIGVTEQTISRWMKTGKIPSRSNILKIARATGCNFKWLKDPNYKGPMMEKGRWAFEANEMLEKMNRQEIGMVYSRLKEIKEANGYNTAQLLAAADIHVHATEDDRHYLGFPPYGMALEKISRVTGFNKDWILTGIGPKYDHTLKIEEPKTEYKLHGGWTPRALGKEWEMIGKTHDILTSKTTYALALRANINAFYHAIELEKKQTDQKKEIDFLKKKCDELIKRVEILEAEKNKGTPYLKP